ncbi:MAG TPA: DUF5131 family protein [Stellaceae bacterium]|nr:DUF5131 family protein [Stellaceae bacterium]
MADTSIEWTDATWNPVAGCTVVSPGCTNCYAMRMAARLDAMGVGKYRGLTRKSGGRAKWTGAVHLDSASLSLPLRWEKPRIIFVNSMSDLFHELVPDFFVVQVWDVMSKASRHTFQILTKRPERMAHLTKALPVLRNVWLGTSVESSEHLDRLDNLRRVGARVRFVSFEPLLGSVRYADLSEIHWAIVGGESGPNARPLARSWVDEIQSACRVYGTAFFFKQWGGRNKKVTGRKIDGKTWDEFPVMSSHRASIGR